MKVLITGGAGYIGSVLSRKLLSDGFNVRVFDNFTFGSKSLDGLDIEIVGGDLTKETDLNQAVKGVDAIIHLAAIVGDPSGKLIPKETVAVNKTGTRRLAEIAKQHGVQKLIMASTCSVYGFQNEVCTEETKTNPVSLYAESKVAAEEALLEVHEVSPVLLRLGTVFGLSPRMRFDLVANLLIAKALWDKKITVYGKGKQFRPFIHVRDVADAMTLAIKTTDMTGVYNVGSDRLNYSINNLAEEIKKSVPDAEIVFIDGKEDNRSYQASFNKITAAGFRAKRDIGHAVREISRVKESGELNDYQKTSYSNFKTMKEKTRKE